jgi:antitoxin PrlF
VKKEKCGSECCKMESIVGVDERGQLVIPKEIRQKAKLKAGDKFALSLLSKNGKVCCIVLTKLEFLNEPVGNLLGIQKGGGNEKI